MDRLFVVVSVILVLSATAFMAAADCTSDSDADDVQRPLSTKSKLFSSKSKELSDLMKKYLDDSIAYLFTSQQFDSQYMQHPGMAKLLSKASDKSWEEGLDILKKLLQRGGEIDDIFPSDFVLSGTGYLGVKEGCFPPADVGQSYDKTLNQLLKNSLDLFDKMNHIHFHAVTVENTGDAECGEWRFFLHGEVKVLQIMDTTYIFNAFLNLNPSLRDFCSGFLSSLLSAHRAKERLRFLRTCLQEQVIPKSLLPDRLVNVDDNPFGEYEFMTLKRCIEMTKEEVSSKFRTSNSKKQCRLNLLTLENQQIVFPHCYQVLTSEINVMKHKHEQKLNRLIENSYWNKHINPDCVINLSSKELDRDTLCALGYGLSFSYGGKINPVHVGKSLFQMEKQSSEDSEMIRGVLYGALFKENKNSVPLRFVKALEKLKKDDTLHITKADKSNAVVIMNKRDYKEKVYDLLRDTDTYRELNKDPTEKQSRKFHKEIKNLLKGREELIKQFSTQNPSTPYMYGLIKTHKPNNPLRPIISCIGSAPYKLSKWLVKLLSPFLGTISDSFIQNSEDLVRKLKSLNVKYPYKLVSFDVKSLFTNVPVDDVLTFLPNILGNNIEGIPSENIIKLIRLCIDNSSFVFEGKYYTQQFGMAMGNPLSPVLANIYMEYFESHLLNTIKEQNIVWFRYVDDVLCFWPNNLPIDDFLHKLNSLAPSIKFTQEVETNNKLPFLDVEIIRDKGMLKTKVYRKPTNIMSYVHYYSNHHINVKRSVFISMYLRAYRISDPEFLDDELKMIQHIGQKLRYPINILNQCQNTARKRFYSGQNDKPERQSHLRTLVLPFHENFLDCVHILKKLNVQVVFKYDNTIKKTLIKNSPSNNTGVVYKVPCKNCNQFYIGQSGKDLKTRISQHKYSVAAAQPSSGLFQHKAAFDHHIDWERSKIIAKSNCFSERNVIESCLISGTFDHNVNMSFGHFKCDKLLNEIVIKKYPPE